ncbi:MAG: hypothetical protein PHI13_04975 [Methylococcales bacterium]|nr:hypothetical protein [Methylococcales bacterium]
MDAQSGFARAFELELERFARNLGEAGVVARPFLGDVETTRTSVLDKKWSAPQKEELRKTPALLMIDVDFKDFDPQANRWVLFTFGSGYWRQRESDPSQLRALLQQISEAVLNNDVDPFGIALSAVKGLTFKQGSEIFNIKPGIFGVSIDLRALGRRIKELYRHSQMGRKGV